MYNCVQYMEITCKLLRHSFQWRLLKSKQFAVVRSVIATMGKSKSTKNSNTHPQRNILSTPTKIEQPSIVEVETGGVMDAATKKLLKQQEKTKEEEQRLEKIRNDKELEKKKNKKSNKKKTLNDGVGKKVEENQVDGKFEERQVPKTLGRSEEHNSRHTRSSSRDRTDLEQTRKSGREPYRSPYPIKKSPAFLKYMSVFKSGQLIENDKCEILMGDLFSAPPEYSVAHCVAEDMAMGAGIAVQFRRKFGSVCELLEQNVQMGGLAVLRKEDRYIYYLVTKRRSSSKPTESSMFESLSKLVEHCREHHVDNLAMPMIGSGLDRLDWNNVFSMIKYLFKGMETRVHVYNLLDNMNQNGPLQTNRCYVSYRAEGMPDIRKGTVVLFFDCVEARTSNVWALKYNCLPEYMQLRRTLGDLVECGNENRKVFGLVVRQSEQQPISYQAVRECLIKLRKRLEKLYKFDLAFEYFTDQHDDLITYKICTLMQNNLHRMSVTVYSTPDRYNTTDPRQY